jgi:DNA-binding XRE family transcriptional regulator
MGEIKPKFIDTGSGAEIVILTRAEYDELVARAEDAEEEAELRTIYDARMEDVLRRPDALLPAEVSAYLMAGDRLLRALRRWRKMTQGELAKRAGLAQGYVSDLESGKREGTSETLASLARALGVSEGWLAPDRPR